MAPTLKSRKKENIQASTSSVKDSGQPATIRRRKWLESLSDVRRAQLRERDRIRKQEQCAKQRGNYDGRLKDTTTPPQDSQSMEMDTDMYDTDRDGADMVQIPPRQNRRSRLVQIDSDKSDTEHA